MRDAIIVPLSGEQSLVITSDNSGAIGRKKKDAVSVSYETVGYFSFRVAVMECLAAKAKPLTVVIQNFCGEEAWQELVAGVKKGMDELQMVDLQITGSTESNFSLEQSAVGINVIGIRSNKGKNDRPMKKRKLALIGRPLVGEEVVLHHELVAPLHVFKRLSEMDDVQVWPVGSKGILYELKRMDPLMEEKVLDLKDIDLTRSAGPSTCFLVSYPIDREREILQVTGTCKEFVILQ